MPRSAIVGGGTGRSGPGTVNGLLARGIEGTILHSGRHEASFDRDVEHILADAHSRDALATALAGRTFDIGIAMYGRLRHVARALGPRVDQPVAVGGVFDARPVTTPEWNTLLADALAHRFELVSMPFELAAPSFPYARDPWTVCHHVLDVSKLRDRLGWRPVASVEDGLAATARWLAGRPLPLGGEDERQVGDPFDYPWEDRYIAAAAGLRRRVADLPRPSCAYRHPYRHPTEAAP